MHRPGIAKTLHSRYYNKVFEPCEVIGEICDKLKKIKNSDTKRKKGKAGQKMNREEGELSKNKNTDDNHILTA